MKYEFEEEFRLDNPHLDFDNQMALIHSDIAGKYREWLEVKLIEARKAASKVKILYLG